ncbi:NADH-quinone oxidoreductase subunit NuoE [Natronospora cellulosivora (SeqCode)]
MACNCGNEEKSREKYLAPLNKIMENYEKKERYLIPVLQEAQDEYGYLPEEVLKGIASYLDLSLSQVYGVVTFYTQFHLEPRGENIIRVCMGTACHVRGGSDVLKAIQDDLGIDSGETSDDLKFTLETVACIGACGLAPVIMINDDTHGRLTPEKMPAILKEYK